MKPQERSRSLLSQLKTLASHSAVYGAADVFSQGANFLLLPLFTRLLTPADYGVLAVLLLLKATAKIVFRLGLDGAFFRVYYDLKDQAERQRLAGTLALFVALVGGTLFLATRLGAGALTGVLFSHASPAPGFVVLVAADVYLGTFAFVPQALLRIQGRASLFSTLALLRHGLNIALKVLLLWWGWGVAGVLWADLLATGLFALMQLPILLRHARLAFVRGHLRELLGFGLPRVPHGLMIQAQNLADRRILEAFVDLAQVGVYQAGYMAGTAVKFALSAFEPAWQPFVYSRIGKPDAPETLARVATYAAAGFVAAGLAVAVFGREMIMVMTQPNFHGAAPLVPIITLAYLFHGVFLLTSIGIAVRKKTRYYPLITFVSAATNIAANLILIPRHGMLGAAWATVLSYAVMAALGHAFSRRVYPIPFETGRLLRLAGAAAAVFALSRLAPSALVPALAFKSATLLLFPLLLWAAGTVTPAERAWLLARVRRFFVA